jgi:hypothetical protein
VNRQSNQDTPAADWSCFLVSPRQHAFQQFDFSSRQLTPEPCALHGDFKGLIELIAWNPIVRIFIEPARQRSLTFQNKNRGYLVSEWSLAILACLQSPVWLSLRGQISPREAAQIPFLGRPARPCQILSLGPSLLDDAPSRQANTVLFGTVSKKTVQGYERAPSGLEAHPPPITNALAVPPASGHRLSRNDSIPNRLR